ncbi:site-specific integrase [Micromonospora sp. H33]|uniref:site-specific integrase n=1 Tax=Micromonospora sp. H33 TaxID=3452215 RepID=UPI003F8AB21F
MWTPAQLAAFLDYVRDDTLFALWWLIALRGLRRGEAAGLRWTDVDLHAGQLSVVRQRTTAGYDVHEGPPKSAASRRSVALDQHTVRVLRQHRERQRQRRQARADAGKVSHDSGYVFTGPDGLPIHPGYLTQRLRLLVNRAGLPPIRLHDLRHGAATLAHAAGADLKTVQDQLGHATIHLTADTYTSVLPETQRQAAEATARLVLDAGLPGDEIRRQVSNLRAESPEPALCANTPTARGCRGRWRPSRATNSARIRRASKRPIDRDTERSDRRTAALCAQASLRHDVLGQRQGRDSPLGA